MRKLGNSLRGLQGAVTDFIVAIDRAGTTWLVPRAPGKWSPSQVVEHVARIMEESANVAIGDPSRFPTINPLLRPFVRMLMFKRILRRKSFTKMKAIDAFTPSQGPRTVADGRMRLESAFTRYDEACRACDGTGGIVASTIFGNVSVADFARLQELHVRHHLEQMPV